MSSIEEEGQKIAQRLGQGVTYRGPWLPYGPKGEFLGHFFQDDAVTETSFVAKTFEEAKASLIKIRKEFDAKPPVFANNPRNTLITEQEWNQAFLRVLPVAFLGLGVLSAAVGIMTLQRYGPLTQRVYSQDGTYLVDVRYGDWRDIRSFVQPTNPDIVAIYHQYGPHYWPLYNFVCSEIDYRRDIGEFWMTPSETLRGLGDCEDSAILLTSLIRAGGAPNCYVALGSLGDLGHAWCEYNGQVLETTFTSARPIQNPEVYRTLVLFNDENVLELQPNGLAEVFQLGRDEELKREVLIGISQY